MPPRGQALNDSLEQTIRQAAMEAIELLRKILDNPDSRDADKLKAAQLLVDLACLRKEGKAADVRKGRFALN